MTEFGARLSEILDEADSLHEATEAAQLSDIFWLRDEVESLDLPRDQRAAWDVRIDVLHRKSSDCLHRLKTELDIPPDAASDPGLADLGAQLNEFRRRLTELWEQIEAEELRLVLEFPGILSGRREPQPPHLKHFAQILGESTALWRRVSDKPASSAPLDLAVALGDLARQLSASPDKTEEATRAAVMAVSLLRCAIRAQPEALKPRLATALVILAQSHLASGQIEDATAAAAEARDLANLDDAPAEVRGLVE